MKRVDLAVNDATVWLPPNDDKMYGIRTKNDGENVVLIPQGSINNIVNWSSTSQRTGFFASKHLKAYKIKNGKLNKTKIKRMDIMQRFIITTTPNIGQNWKDCKFYMANNALREAIGKTGDCIILQKIIHRFSMNIIQRCQNHSEKSLEVLDNASMN